MSSRRSAPQTLCPQNLPADVSTHDIQDKAVSELREAFLGIFVNVLRGYRFFLKTPRSNKHKHKRNSSLKEKFKRRSSLGTGLSPLKSNKSKDKKEETDGKGNDFDRAVSMMEVTRKRTSVTSKVESPDDDIARLKEPVGSLFLSAGSTPRSQPAASDIASIPDINTLIRIMFLPFATALAVLFPYAQFSLGCR